MRMFIEIKGQFIANFASQFLRILMLAVLAISLASCATNTSNKRYSTAAVGQSAETFEAVVVNKRFVRIDGTQNDGVGAVSGAYAGAAVGAESSESVAGLVGGAIIGGIAGHQLEKKLTETEAYEYIIKITSGEKSGKLLTILQSDEFLVGEDVYLIDADKPVIIRKG